MRSSKNQGFVINDGHVSTHLGCSGVSPLCPCQRWRSLGAAGHLAQVEAHLRVVGERKQGLWNPFLLISALNQRRFVSDKNCGHDQPLSVVQPLQFNIIFGQINSTFHFKSIYLQTLYEI